MEEMPPAGPEMGAGSPDDEFLKGIVEAGSQR
jgi:hypothetical protein